MKIGTKLMIGFFIIFLMVSVLGALSYISLREISLSLKNDVATSVDDLTSKVQLDGLANLIRYYDEILTQSARNYVFTNENKWRQRYIAFEEELVNTINEAGEKSSAEDIEIFNNIGIARAELTRIENIAIQAASQSSNNSNETQNARIEALSLLESQEYKNHKDSIESNLKNYFDQREVGSDSAIESASTIVKASIKDINDLVAKFIKINIGVIALILITALGVGFLITYSVSVPISKLIRATQEIKKQNYKVKTHIKSKDEFKELSNSFNETAIKLDLLEQERQRLEKAKTEFLSITSHELRSPMTPMKAQLQMVLREYYGDINEKQKEPLEMILRNTKRLDRLIEDLLEVSRIESARLKFNFVKANLANHTKKVIKEMEGFLPEKKIKIIPKIDKLPTILVDPDRVMQVLRNLLNNAKKFSPENGKIWVTAKFDKPSNMIYIKVKDQGEGIEKDSVDKLFEPFYQTKEGAKKKHKGTGLGLAICKGIITSQKGKIWVKSIVGKGTTFHFTVPLEPVKKIQPIKLMFSQGSLGKENKLSEDSEENEIQSNKEDLPSKEKKTNISFLEKLKLFKNKILGKNNKNTIEKVKKDTIKPIKKTPKLDKESSLKTKENKPKEISKTENKPKTINESSNQIKISKPDEKNKEKPDTNHPPKEQDTKTSKYLKILEAKPNLKVYSETGEFIGIFEDYNIKDNKIEYLKIKLAKKYKIKDKKGAIINSTHIITISDKIIVKKEISHQLLTLVRESLKKPKD